MTLTPQLAQQCLEALEGLIEAATSEANEKGAGGYLFARLHDAKESAAALREALASGEGGEGAMVDWLEAQINEHGAIHLHDGEHPSGNGLGLRPGSVNRTLREAIRAAMKGNGK